MKNFILKFKKHFKKILISLGIVGIAYGATLLSQEQPNIAPVLVKSQEEQLFAEIDKNSIVIRVIVASQEFIDSGILGDKNHWIKTSFKGAIRKNYAGKGYTYDKKLDAFIPPKSYKSWILDEETCLHKAPVAMPKDGKIYIWNEDKQGWVEREAK